MLSSRTLLIASLALNLFVVGVLFGAGGMYLTARQAKRDAPAAAAACAPAGPSLWALSARLTPPHRKALQDYLTREGEALAEPIHQLRTQRRRVVDALGADRFDADAVSRAQISAQEQSIAIRRRLTAGLTALMADFTPEERRLLAEAVQKSRVGRPSDIPGAASGPAQAPAATPAGAPSDGAGGPGAL